MSFNQNYINEKSAYNRYEEYINGGRNQGENAAHFERTNNFREGLSLYRLEHRTIEAGANCKWDVKNCAGVPVDYERNKNSVYVDGSDSHTLLIGATGSKKSRLIVMPTVRILAADNENMIVCDPKGEIYWRTSKFLKQNGYQIHVINLREPQKSDGWNMLSVPYELYHTGRIDKAYEFVNDMTINLVPIIAKDPYWDYSARDLLFGLILLLFKICNTMNISSELVNMQSVLRLREELFAVTDSNRIQNSDLWLFIEDDDLIRTRLIGTVICPENTMSCILSTFDQHMSCFSLQPKVVEMLSYSSFNLNEIGFQKCAVFLIMPDEKTTFHKIIAAFLKQMYELLIDNAFYKTKEGRFPSRINFILDEFSSLPAISDFPQMIAASRSRNIRFVLVVQSEHQLQQRYQEETDTIMSNCSNWIFLASREIQLLREISELGGTTGADRHPLISISKLQYMDKEKGECLVFCGRKRPYIAKLPDIEKYDHDAYLVPDIQVKEKYQASHIPYKFFTEQVHQYKQKGEKGSKKNDTSVNLSDENEDASIMEELEKKFDELFGEDENPTDV